MKLGIVIYSNNPETVFNAFRLGLFSLQKEDEVKVFLLASGVESETLDNDKFSISEKMQSFVDSGGEIFTCGTCLKIRKSDSTDLCPISTIEDLYAIIEQSDKVITL
ncbi:uncharacterized protein METZ01_LOCUS446263 [marine metagenome]|jgi:uncharacterized protein involved in oxidation of intracellular sulfur|uniref:Uncharacterized protein n=1 Tax=marine metagenome TaxID=408172 RepID=A0A382ZDX9_9ZZZZ